MTLNQILNRVLFYGREPGWNPDPTQAPTVIATADYNATFLTNEANLAAKFFMLLTGMAASVNEKYVAVPVVAGLDFTLPSDATSLVRVEYITALAGTFKLDEKTFDEFDELTGGGYDDTDTGYPTCYRMPFGVPPVMKIRLWPQPTAANVAAGDTVGLYYTPEANVLALGTDSPSFALDLHEAIPCLMLARLWRRKSDDGQSTLYMNDFLEFVRMGKALGDNLNRAGQPSIGDAESVETSDTLFGFP